MLTPFSAFLSSATDFYGFNQCLNFSLLVYTIYQLFPNGNEYDHLALGGLSRPKLDRCSDMHGVLVHHLLNLFL